MDSAEKLIRGLADKWLWTVSSIQPALSNTSKIKVFLGTRSVKVYIGQDLTDLAATILAVFSGVYGETIYDQELLGCLGASKKVKVKYFSKDLTGPSYWSNSCPVDSLLSIISFSSGVPWRALIEVDVIKKQELKTINISKELYLPQGKCKVTRKSLVGESTKTRRVGEIYDLLTDVFPSLKFPVVKKHPSGDYSTFYSSFPLEDFIEGNLQDFNYPLLVLENNLSYSDPESLKPEPQRPLKKKILETEILDGKYELCGVIYQSGVESLGEDLEEIHQTKSLGTHYYSALKLPDQRWYIYDDLTKKVKLILTNKISYYGRDPGILYFYQRRLPLIKKSLVVLSDLKIEVDIKEAKLVAELSKLFQTADYNKDSIVITFSSLEKRIDFELKIRKTLF